MHTFERKRKIDDERRVFNKGWTSKYFFTDIENKAVWLLCQETIAVLKKFNLNQLNVGLQRPNKFSNVKLYTILFLK